MSVASEQQVSQKQKPRALVEPNALQWVPSGIQFVATARIEHFQVRLVGGQRLPGSKQVIATLSSGARSDRARQPATSCRANR